MTPMADERLAHYRETRHVQPLDDGEAHIRDVVTELVDEIDRLRAAHTPRAANPHTDQMAAEVREKLNAEPDAPEFATLATALGRRLTEVLPDLPTHTLGEVVLHASSHIGSVYHGATEHHGRDMCPEAMNVISLLAIVGEQLYTERPAS